MNEWDPRLADMGACLAGRMSTRNEWYEGLSKRVQSAGYLQEVDHPCGLHVRKLFSFDLWDRGARVRSGSSGSDVNKSRVPQEIHPTSAFCQAGLEGYW